MMRECRRVSFQVRATSDQAGARSFEGYGSVFNTVDSYDDTIVKGAFANTLKEWQAKGKLPKLLLQHGGWGIGVDDLVPIGKWDEMREDDHGLFVRGHLFDLTTDRAVATYAALKEGELDGLSIGFYTRKSSEDETTGIRTLTDIDLWEVSLVTFPANDPARVSAVKAAGELPSERDFERHLRRAGFGAHEATTIITEGFRALLRDAAPAPASDDVKELLAAVERRGALLKGVSAS